MIHVAIVGGATGREHCLVKELVRTGRHRVSAILWDPHEPIRRLVSSFAVLDLRDPAPIVDLLSKWKPDYVVIGQGQALFHGLVDRLHERGIPSIAPTLDQARIESSRSFLRKILEEQIGPEASPRSRLFTKANRDLADFAQTVGPRVVLKCESPVRHPRVQILDVTTDPKSILAIATLFLQRAGAVVVEEFVEGDEIAMISFSDGRTLLHSPPFRNFKTVDDKDQGEMTSGMGALAGLELMDPHGTLAEIRSISEAVFSWLVRHDERPYVGCLYGEFRIAPGSRAKVLEYNSRFGNPATINLSLLLEQGMPSLLDAMASGSLSNEQFNWSPDWSLSAYAVPFGYTREASGVGKPINFSHCDPENIYVGKLSFNSGTYRLQNSRALAVCVRAPSLQEVREVVYRELAKVVGPLHYRTDIGSPQPR